MPIKKNLLFLLLVIFAGCGNGDKTASDRDYEQAVSDFYVSLAASQTQEARFAFNKMNEVSTALPDEPAAHANLGVMAMRQGNTELAAEHFGRARELAEDHPEVLFLSGIFESRRGEIDAAVDFYRSALEAAPDNLKIRYALLKELERQDPDQNSDEIISQVRQLREQVPDNRVMMLEQARIAVREQEPELLVDAIESLSRFRDEWSEEAKEQFDYVEELTGEPNYAELNLELAFLRNVIEPASEFQSDLRQLRLEPNEVGFLITEFINVSMPAVKAAEPDPDIMFERQHPDQLPEQAAMVTSAVLLEDLAPLPIALFDGALQIDSTTVLDYPRSTDQRLSKNVMTLIDYNYDFRNDIALAGDQGFRLYQHEEDGSFTDITSQMGISSQISSGSYSGVWPADVDLDGDLDLVLAPLNGEVFSLRNNTDGTFERINLFNGAEQIIDFFWADLDADGAADPLFLNSSGELQLFRNQRSNRFHEEPDLPIADSVAAIEIADLDANGFFDILVVGFNSEIIKLSYDQGRDSWEHNVLIQADDFETSLQTGESELFSADVDNNGSLDIILSNLEESKIWLSDNELNLTQLSADLPGGIQSIFDINGNERLDLLGLDSDQIVYSLMNSGMKNYHARSIRARASGLEGDQRINSFGIGGEMEVRSGLQYQKQLIRSPIVHFGLGQYEEADMLRIIWPNGSVQAEFAELGMGSTIFNEQILKGSCPWLFTNDGEDVQFITDILWRSPLGLRINAQETAGVVQTLDRVRIPGENLKPVDEIYDVRITAELWETHFFDFVDLVAVDHPEGTEIFVDERFVFPAPDLSTKVMNNPEPVTSVTDSLGNVWTETISELDQNYIKPFKKTSYQGLAEDHYVEITLPESAPQDQTLWLVASGWLRPTDSSINLALSQGNHQAPRGLQVEVQDGNGSWKTIHEDFGVPAGKTKTILIDIDQNAFEDSSNRKVRLSTTSEIYWDSIEWTTEPGTQFTEQSLKPVRQELRYRGYSEWNRADELSPLIPNYSELSGTTSRWRDLKGFHTRFGDVMELLDEIDDRYVIMNAGDELILEFEWPGEPPEGFTRSFVFVSDGWEKDGDYNTEESKTVAPLPYHGQADYDYASGSDLYRDPVYKKHRNDWINYHTRYVTPESFRSALIFDNE